MKKFDVAIIGSGPSGASAAFKLAENGISTVIIEKETLPRYKTCGGGFVYRGRRKMPFDVSSVVDREFHKIDIYFNKAGLHLSSEREEPIISMIMRDEFDNLIVEKSKALGVTLLEAHTLKDHKSNMHKNLKYPTFNRYVPDNMYAYCGHPTTQGYTIIMSEIYNLITSEVY